MSPLDRVRWVAHVCRHPLPSTAYRLAAIMAETAADGTGCVWAAKQTMADGIGCHVTRLPKAFRSMEAAGLIHRGYLTGQPGRQTYKWELIPPASDAPPAGYAPGASSAIPPPASDVLNPPRPALPKGGIKGGIDGGSRTRTRFTPPTIDEVTAYCAERGNMVDPERWLAHYEANGWKVGRNPMKDWKAAVRTWERQDGTNTSEPSTNLPRLDLPQPDDDVIDRGLVPPLGRIAL